MVAVLLGVQVHAAEIYQCTDANGRAVFSQVRCGTNAGKVNVDVYQPTASEVREAKQRTAEAGRIVDSAVARERASQRDRERKERSRRSLGQRYYIIVP